MNDAGFAAQQETHEIHEHVEAPPHVWPEQGRILIVDENREWAESLALALVDAGYTVVTEHEARSGVTVASWFRPDVVVMDIRLTGLTAFDACKSVRRHAGKKAPLLIAITALPGEWSKERAKVAGFDFYLAKPKQPEGLVPTLRAI